MVNANRIKSCDSIYESYSQHVRFFNKQKIWYRQEILSLDKRIKGSAMDNSIFRSLTCGVTFKKEKVMKKPLPIVKKEEIKIDSDSADELNIVKEPAKKRKKLSEAYLQQKQLEDTSKIRKQHNINVKGSVEKIKPIESFDELFERYPLNQQLVENIKSFKYTQPTPVQMQVLPLFLEQKALKVVAPTGSGK